MRTTSSTRKSAVVLLAFGFFFPFMLRHRRFDPAGVPVVQAGVVDEGELLAGAAVAAQVGAPLDREALARRQRQGDDLRVRVAARRPLLAGAELVERLGPHLA